MKRIIQFFIVGLVLSSNASKAQSVGATAQLGAYSAKYTNPNNTEETVTGKGHLSLGATYEVKLDNKGQLSIPFVLNYTRFGTEQNFGENQIMTQDANTLNLGAGAKYFINSDEHTIRPFAAALISYEALLNSTYYYEAQQAGDLDWRSNAYLGIQMGVGIETGLNARIDIFGSFNLGLLNRLDKETYGTYKDNVIALGLNFVFN